MKDPVSWQPTSYDWLISRCNESIKRINEDLVLFNDDLLKAKRARNYRAQMTAQFLIDATLKEIEELLAERTELQNARNMAYARVGY